MDYPMDSLHSESVCDPSRLAVLQWFHHQQGIGVYPDGRGRTRTNEDKGQKATGDHDTVQTNPQIKPPIEEALISPWDGRPYHFRT